MKLETLHRLLHLESSGRPCGAKTAKGPCMIEGFQPTGRCHRQGASAQRGPKGRRRLTRVAQRRLSKEVTARMMALGILDEVDRFEFVDILDDADPLQSLDIFNDAHLLESLDRFDDTDLS